MENNPENQDVPAVAPEHIIPSIIQDEMKHSYLSYAMSVIVARAIPDVRDGLKPVHRRILFAMNEMGMVHSKPFKKCARVVGEVLGKFHPHGDTAIYDSLVRMAQDFSLRYPLIQGQGNFGSIDGDRAAAMRYCVTGDSLVITERGLEKIGKISEIEDINTKILSKDKNIYNASKWFDSGEHSTLKLTTNKGYSLTGTFNHPVLTLTADNTGKPQFLWKLMENVLEGDYVVIDRSVDEFWPENNLNLQPFWPEPTGRTKQRILPKQLDKDLAFILGSFIAEGSLTETKIEFCNVDKKWIEEIERVWKKVFPDSTLHKFKRKPSSFGQKEYYRLECHYLHTIEFLRNIGLDAVKSGNRSLPETILQSPKRVAAEFLKAYFECGGTITSAPKMVELGCCSKSEKLVSDLQIFLLRFGIDSVKRYDKRRFVWKLYLRGKRNVLRFYKELGFLSDYKTKKLEFILHNYQKDTSLTDYVPFISDYIKSRTDNCFVNKKNFDRYSSMKENYQEVSSTLLLQTGVNYSSMFEYLLTYNYLFEKVVSIQEAGIQQVFSLKVDSDCHSFISNGIISHNTESRLNKLAEMLLQDIDKKTVEFTPNFDGSMEEPEVLPAIVPNLLINGSSGIAVGMATNIPPHNLNEVTAAAIFYVENPEAKVQDLLPLVQGPDFPTGGLILGTAGIKDAYTHGRGKIKVRAKHEIEESKDREHIIISEIPYMVNKSMLLQQIADLVRSKTITSIADIRDESDRQGMRIVITLKKGAVSDVVANQLFKHSRLQVTFGINMLAIVGKEPKTLSLLDVISEFVNHRQIVVRKRTEFDLDKAEKQAHILEGLIIALDDIDRAIALIKASKSTETAMQALKQNYSLTDLQAKAILEMRLQRLTNLEQDKIRIEHAKLLELITELKSILADEQKILRIIKEELELLQNEFGDNRKTEILHVDDDESSLDMEDLIADTEMIVTISHSGYIKRLPTETYKQQRRGGKGIVAANTKEEDFIEDLFVASTHSYLLCFTESGQVHWIKVYQLPEASRQSMGKAIVNLLGTQERVTAILPVKEFNDTQFIVMVTKNGTVKRIELDQFNRPRRGGIRALTLDDGDSLVNAVLTNGSDEILIATKNGNAVRCNETDVRPIGRAGRGVRGIFLTNDEVIGMVISKPCRTILTITEHGYGKRTPVEDYRLINRGGKGVINIKCSERNGNVVAIASVEENDDVMFISQDGIIIRTGVAEVSNIGRNTQGVRLMRLKGSDKVVALAKVIKDDTPIDGENQDRRNSYNGDDPDDVITSSAETSASFNSDEEVEVEELSEENQHSDLEHNQPVDPLHMKTVIPELLQDRPQEPVQHSEQSQPVDENLAPNTIIPTVQDLMAQKEKPLFDKTPSIQELMELKKRNKQ